MKRQRLAKWLGFIILVLSCGYCVSRYWLLPFLMVTATSKPPDRTPEVIFASRVLDGQPMPSDVIEIEALEGPIGFGYSSTTAFVRFKATDSFIAELIEKDHGCYGVYTPMPCDNSPIKDGLVEKISKTPKWWQPSKIVSPICYATSTCILYDMKYLLIDPDNDVGYFYRTAICGLCPSGEQGRALRESPHCLQPFSPVY